MNLRSGIYNHELRITIILIESKSLNYIYWSELKYAKFIRN